MRHVRHHTAEVWPSPSFLSHTTGGAAGDTHATFPAARMSDRGRPRHSGSKAATHPPTFLWAGSRKKDWERDWSSHAGLAGHGHDRHARWSRRSTTGALDPVDPSDESTGVTARANPDIAVGTSPLAHSLRPPLAGRQFNPTRTPLSSRVFSLPSVLFTAWATARSCDAVPPAACLPTEMAEMERRTGRDRGNRSNVARAILRDAVSLHANLPPLTARHPGSRPRPRSRSPLCSGPRSATRRRPVRHHGSEEAPTGRERPAAERIQREVLRRRQRSARGDDEAQAHPGRSGGGQRGRRGGGRGARRHPGIRGAAAVEPAGGVPRQVRRLSERVTPAEGNGRQRRDDSV